MSYLMLRAGNVESTLKLLAASKFNVEGTGEKTCDTTSIYLHDWLYESTLRKFETVDVVNLGKNMVMITPNPVIGEILGVQPACPVTIAPGYFGAIEVGVSSASDEEIVMIQEALAGEEAWLVRCTYIPAY